MDTVKISGDTWIIKDGGVYFFLLEGSERAALIDTGMTTADARRVAEGLTDKPLMLMNTHCDRDHVAGNGEFDTVYMHASEMAFYSQTHRGQRLEALFDGDIIDLGGRELRVIALPGHTAGSAAYLDVSRRVLISGDSIQRGGRIYMFGPQRNMPAYIAGLKRLKEKHSGEFDEIWPCHAEIPLPASVLDLVIADAERAEAGLLPLTPEEVNGNAILAAKGEVNTLLLNAPEAK